VAAGAPRSLSPVDDARDRPPEVVRKGALRDRAELPRRQAARRSALHQRLLPHTSQGEEENRGPWNQGEKWEFVPLPQNSEAVDGGDGLAVVAVADEEAQVLKQMVARTMSDPSGDPLTGAELGMAGGQPDNVP
jgi:hypothetical protein